MPLVLYEQFKFFFNLYFLLVALSQFVPALRIGKPLCRQLATASPADRIHSGFLATYVVPLAFVLAVTIGKEAYDDYIRFLRDKAANSTLYSVLSSLPHSHHASTSPFRSVPSSKLKVGDLVQLEKNARVPADLLLLRCSDPSGACFVRTDQLDGETDWKLRVAVSPTQGLASDADLLDVRGTVTADPPTKDIHTFNGSIELTDLGESTAAGSAPLPKEPLTSENMLWANTVLAAGSAIGLVVYTGRETRAVMNTSQPGTKVGLLDHEINRLAKILCTVTFALSVTLVALNGFRGQWYIYVFRFLILFSSIIPISSVPTSCYRAACSQTFDVRLRVNLDMGKTVYAHQIMHDNEIPETIVRTSTLPEELGRIEYLLSDKTGTLTQNGKSILSMLS